MHFNDLEASRGDRKSLFISITSPFWVHRMFVGGFGLCETMHVRLIVEPVSMNISGWPMIVVIGSEETRHEYKAEVE